MYTITGTCEICKRDLWRDDSQPDGDDTNMEDWNLCMSCHLDFLEDNPPTVWTCLVHHVNFTEKCPACVEEQDNSEQGQISILYMSIVAILTGIIAGQSVIFNCLSKLINTFR